MRKVVGAASTGGFSWNYDRGEIIADGIIHALGICFGLFGAIAIVTAAIQSAKLAAVPAAAIYATGLLAMFSISAAYNMWPISPVKWILRRFDHSAIYILIAATYTPFLALMKGSSVSIGLLVAIWAAATLGIVLKLVLPGRFDRLAVALYLLMGWTVLIDYDTVIAPLPTTVVGWLIAGGVLYSAGVIFHVWHSLRFQNAIWHVFVLLAALCHYAAVLNYVTV